MENNSEEPSTAPEPGHWYNIKLGPSFEDNHHHGDYSPKLCTLRYEFKPASIDSSQPGSLHKSKDNRVTVEFQNNQQGKPKVIFEGVEDYRDNDAVLIFDGETFRLERLHRAVNCLRHVRLPGEQAAAAASSMTTSVVPLVESYTNLVGKGSKLQSSNTGIVHEAVKQIDIGNSTSSGPDPESGKDVEFSPSLPKPSTSSPDEPEENVDIVDNNDRCETEKGANASEMEARTGLDIDINLPHQMDIDVEISDVDISDNEADKGPNAAEALRAQVNAEGREGQSSSSSSSSDSESTGSESGSGSRSGSGSESGSVSTSTDTESSDGDSVNSV